MPRDKAPKHLFTTAESAEVRRMHAEGKTDLEIARVLDLTRNQVWSHRCRALKLPANTKAQPDWTAAEDEKLWNLCYIQKRSFKEAAGRLPGRTNIAAKKRFATLRKRRQREEAAAPARAPEVEMSLLRQENKMRVEDYLRRQRLPEGCTWQPGDPVT